MPPDILVIGMAAHYAGARGLAQLWETLLTRRPGFRAFPARRLPPDYIGDERDLTYVTRAALIDGFVFDWKARRVPKAAFEATDPVHWLALATAGDALSDSGADLDAVGRERIGVILGNSLTGEVSRANLLRLRWPYVRRAVAAGAARAGLDASATAALLADTEDAYKAGLPVPNEDTLAGALSNVIAGRICNVLDINGGGYVVDGACASSLLAVAQACEALTAGRLDMAIAGGVDLSLDPLEMVGFARTGALTTGSMRVYDRDAAGFLPGEGCGMLVLMRAEDAARHGLAPWARLAGWGISSDGVGGITAPKASGQALAMRRCYALAGFGAETLDLIEGHGTGTPVGDREELAGFLDVTGRDPGAELRRIGVTSVKTLLGHTKAAAGAAGLIKAVLAVNQRVLPPMAGLRRPAEAFASPGARIYPIGRGAVLPPETPLRAGVSGAGFGGINCHLAVSGEGLARRALGTADAAQLLASAQSAELFIASADDLPGLAARLQALHSRAEGMAEGELADLAAQVALRDRARPLRAAVVAGDVAGLRARLDALIAALASAGPGAGFGAGTGDKLPATAPPGTLLGRAREGLRIGLLFPGQGSQFLGMGGTLAARAGWAASRRARWDAQFTGLGPAGLSGLIDRPLERAADDTLIQAWEAALRETRVAQPAIAMTSLQWLQWLRQIGLSAVAVGGHSLGEIPALVAAGLLSETEAVDLVRLRADACAADGVPAGGMLALRCALAQAQGLLDAAGGYAVVANDNAPTQVVVAGEPEALALVAELASARGIDAVALNVSRAFHSQHMAGAAAALGELARLQGEVRPARIAFYSAVTGGAGPERLDPFAYLTEQVVAPVRFRGLVEAMAGACDILLEPGPGAVLSALARQVLGDTGIPVCALEPGGDDGDAGHCMSLGRLYVAGAPLDWQEVYADRHVRPFVPAAERVFIESPCGLVADLDPALTTAVEVRRQASPRAVAAPADAALAPAAGSSVEDTLRALVAAETGYDLDMISADARLARDLNLDSIKVAEVRAELRARGIELPEDLPLGTTPIRDIALVAVRRDAAPALDGGSDAATGSPPSDAVPLPKNLPVLGYAQTWRPATLTALDGPLPPLLILHASERAAEAQALAVRLQGRGAVVRIDAGPAESESESESDSESGPGPGPEPAAGAPAPRLLVLSGPGLNPEAQPGEDAASSALLARAAHLAAAGAEALILLSAPGQTPVQTLDQTPDQTLAQGLAPVLGFAQSLSLDLPALPVLAAEVAAGADLLPLALAAVAPGVGLLRLDAAGACTRPVLEPWRPIGAPRIPLAADDLVVISGGAKGITAECALALLRVTGARALLLGTSPEAAPGAEVEGTLARFAAEGAVAHYIACDVTDAASLRAALERGLGRIGARSIAGIVHGAGINLPAPAARLEAGALAREYAVKVRGLANLLDAVDPSALKLCVGFGSVIGAVGMHGNAGYALANEALAALLARLRQALPDAQVACPAYGVWSEVGMGAKLDVIEALERQHVAAISIDEGVGWFLDCCGQREVPLPLVVAAPMHGLPTWRQARGTAAAVALPYCEPRVVHEPGEVLVARPALNPARDTWLSDHAFRGTLLFPTVQVFTAIAAGARLLAGGGAAVRFTDLRIDHPIVCAHDGDTALELYVRRDGDAWRGRFGTPGGADLDPAFDVRCWLGDPTSAAEQPEAEPVATELALGAADGFVAVPAEVAPRLYDSLLFQRGQFQRIEAMLGLDLADGVHRRARFRVRRDAVALDAPLPDAFFIDALLQTVQVLVPRDMCLPVGIDDVRLFAAAWQAGATLVEAEITLRTDTGYVTRVRASDGEGGAPVAVLEGYRVSIVERHPGRPDADALLDPLSADQAVLAQWRAGYPDLAGLDTALGAVDERDLSGRRAAAAAQIAGQIGIDPAALAYDPQGRPSLPAQPEQGVSIAHDAGRLLTLCGAGRVGCDLQRVGPGPRPWEELLPSARAALRHALTHAIGDRERAGALCWAIHEALVKAGAEAAEVVFFGLQDGVPRLSLGGLGQVVAGILELTLAGPTAIALVHIGNAPPSRGRVTHYRRDIAMTFKEALPPLKSPTAPIYFGWMGELREEAMAAIRAPLAQAFGDGGKGMLTNGTRLRILHPVPYQTPLRAWVWLERVLDSQPSTFELGFQWAETGADGSPGAIVAEGIQRLTWVDLGLGLGPNLGPELGPELGSGPGTVHEAGGQVRVEPFPAFFADFIAERRAPPGEPAFRPPAGRLPEPADDEPVLWRRDPATGEHGSARLWLETDEMHSNYVGNIYFSHVAALLERTCRKALRMAGGCDGGFYATALEINHLGEAMPGDTLEAEAHLVEVRPSWCCLDLVLLNKSRGGERIAAGRARYRLFAAAADPTPRPLPSCLLPTVAESQP